LPRFRYKKEVATAAQPRMDRGVETAMVDGVNEMSNASKNVPNLRDMSSHRNGTRPSTVRPLHDRVIVKRIAEEETSKGGIIIPDSAKEKPLEGQVVAVGPGRRDDNGKIGPLGVAKGDRILFGKYSGTDVEIDGEEHLILQENDILGVIEK
jgi:chaperonin GroES